MRFDTLRYDVRDGVAWITLNRPDAANALDLAMAKDLLNAALAVDADRAVRAVVIGSTGKLFCAGGDLSAMRAAGDGRPALLAEMTTHLHAALSRFARMDAPVLASVQGTAAGAGASLVFGADLVICSESAKFTLAYTAAGLVPDGGSTYHLPRIVGTRRALELMLTNRRLDAKTAAEWGIVNRVVPDADLARETAALAAQLAAGATGAFGATKRLVADSFDHAYEAQLAHEARGITEASRSADADEGIRAFLDKRAPKFGGR